MFIEAGAPHHRPRFHAYDQDASAVFAIDPVECVGGALPKTQQRLVGPEQRFTARNFNATGSSCKSGQPPFKIEPLR